MWKYIVGDNVGSQVCVGWNALPDPIIFDACVKSFLEVSLKRMWDTAEWKESLNRDQGRLLETDPSSRWLASLFAQANMAYNLEKNVFARGMLKLWLQYEAVEEARNSYMY